LRAFLDDRIDPEFQEWKTTWQDSQEPGADTVRETLQDLDLYLGTAFRLVRESDPGEPTDDEISPAHWQQSVVNATDTLKRNLYGDVGRLEDMTLYKPRGHYTNSSLLKGYFQTVVWLSQSQFHLTNESSSSQWDRELRAAILMTLIVRDSGAVLHEGVGRAQFMLVAVKHPDGSI
jgi:hypothetical protein